MGEKIQFKGKGKQLYPYIEAESDVPEDEPEVMQECYKLRDYIDKHKIPLKVDFYMREVRNQDTQTWETRKYMRVSDKGLKVFNTHIEYDITPTRGNVGDLGVVTSNITFFYQTLVKDLGILMQVRKAKGSLVKGVLHGNVYRLKYYDNERNKLKPRYRRYAKRIAWGFGVSLVFFGLTACI